MDEKVLADFEELQDKHEAFVRKTNSTIDKLQDKVNELENKIKELGETGA